MFEQTLTGLKESNDHILLLSSAPSDKDKKKAQTLKEEGNSLVKKGEHKKAIEKYSQSLKLNPTEITTYTNRYVTSSSTRPDF